VTQGGHGVPCPYNKMQRFDGPIIEQDVIRISYRDSVQDLVQKGRDLEKIVLSRAVGWHLENRVLLYGNKTVVFD
jgi:formyltetrahydrofolate deformylase